MIRHVFWHVTTCQNHFWQFWHFLTHFWISHLTCVLINSVKQKCFDCASNAESLFIKCQRVKYMSHQILGVIFGRYCFQKVTFNILIRKLLIFSNSANKYYSVFGTRIHVVCWSCLDFLEIILFVAFTSE